MPVSKKKFYPKIINLFYMNLDDDKLYIKIVAPDAIYNFVVQKFLFETM